MSDAGSASSRCPGWPKPKGYANGVITEGRRSSTWPARWGGTRSSAFESDDFARQFAQALDNVLAVVRAAGGRPEGVVKMTVYVTDLAAYRASQRALGPVWRERFGRHFPAMALVGVAGLVEEGALVEIEAVVCSAGGGGRMRRGAPSRRPLSAGRRRRRARRRARSRPARSPCAPGCGSSPCRSGRSRPSATTSSAR